MRSQFLPDFQRTAQTGRFAVRVEAARAIATFDAALSAL
jgi:hypothetical protein